MFDVDNLWIYGKNKNWKNRCDTKTENNLPVISGITINNGVNYYTNDLPTKNDLFNDSLTISTRGEYSGTVTYHKGKFLLANNILVMEMPNLTRCQKLFIGSLINNLPYGGYNGYPRKETLKEDKILLPTKNGEIDFEFMDAYISELEEERISELAAYLTVSGLDNYELSSEEKEAIENISLIKWEEKDVTGQEGIFNVKNTKNILSSEIIPNSGNTPYLCAGADNNSVSSYIFYKESLKDKGNCIFIGGKTFVVSYQEVDFFSNDSHNLALYLKQKDKSNKITQLFLTTCIKKSLSHKYSWGDSISNKKIQKDKIMLPTKNNEIDFSYMELLISAVKKLVIKDVVLYADNKISATKHIVENKK